MTDTPELKPCPFCGGEAEIFTPTICLGCDDDDVDWLKVICKKCASSRGYSRFRNHDRRSADFQRAVAEAAAIWNTRAPTVDVHEPTPTAVDDSAAANTVANGTQREITQAAIAIAIAKAMGDNFSNAFKNKERWIAKRGMSGGRFRDINEPMQCDYLAAAQAALATAAPLIRAQIADNLDAMRRDETNWPQVIARLIREGGV